MATVVTITREQMLAGIVKPDKAQPIDWSLIADTMRWWVGGNHDSDGCTTLDYKHGPRVMVVKAENGYGCLEVLKLMLGGTIYKQANESEEQQATKCWSISGRTAIEFCVNMKNFLFLKRPQLEKMSEYPIDDLQIMQMQPVMGRHLSDGSIILAPSLSAAGRAVGKRCTNIHTVLDLPDRAAYGYRWSRLPNPVDKEETQNKCRVLEQELREMKHTEHLPIECDLPIPYVSGNIDGDGCMYLSADTIYPKISLGQKYSPICDALKRQYGGSVRYREQRGFSSYTWSLVGQQQAQDVIREIMPYLIEKKVQAELLLEMVETTDPGKVREQFRKTRGRQGANMRAKLVNRLLLESN